MSTPEGSNPPSRGRAAARAAQAIVVSSVMLTFISYRQTAAVVLCDIASTAYYIGGIVEQSIGPAAPWFILAVMLFSYAVRSVYIESCSLFVRGGVYKVVKEALGGFLAKLSVSALMFDYVLTGPISGVSAGQYLIGLGLELLRHARPDLAPAKEADDLIKGYGSAAIAAVITVYFFRQNLRGIHESSSRAVQIMKLTTVMAVVMLVWCGVTLAVRGPAPVDPANPNGPRNSVPLTPDFHPKMNYDAGQVEDPLGFVTHTAVGDRLRDLGGSAPWLSLVGLAGLAIAFGHSILAMSGEETLAQVYREVESPKLPNFKKAAFVVFVYSLLLTGGISFLAVLLIPQSIRMEEYSGNLIGGLAMNVMGPAWARLLLNVFVVVVGSLILSGAVNTAIIGSNGVLNRVAEDGVLPDWFLKPHPRYGTTHRILWLILGLQLATIAYSRGNVIVLGEAYAFGVVWSFVFKALAMLVLRFRQPGRREYKVPLNLRVGRLEIPIGLGLIFLTLLAAAVTNLLTKEMATTWGLGFTAAFLTVFVLTERAHLRRRGDSRHQHLEQFNRGAVPEPTAAGLGLTRPFRRLVAIRSPQNLFMLEKALAETDPHTTEVVVMTARVRPPGGSDTGEPVDLDPYDRELMTAVVERAEQAGKPVRPLIVPTNNPLHAVLRTAQGIGAQELVVGASNIFTAEEQLDQIALYWLTLHGGSPAPLTVRLLSRNRDVTLDLAGGSPIPKPTARPARSAAELRAAGVGVRRVLLAHDGTAAGRELFDSALTMLDPDVALDVIAVPPGSADAVADDVERAAHVGRGVDVFLATDPGPDVIRRALDGQYDLVLVRSDPRPGRAEPEDWVREVMDHAPCPVSVVARPPLPVTA